MENLHGVLRTLQGETKSQGTKPADHLTVFRDFIAHLDRLSRIARPRTKARPVKKRARK